MRLPWLDHELGDDDSLVEVAVVDRRRLRAGYAAIRHPSGDWTIVHRIVTGDTDRRDLLVADAHDGPITLAEIKAMMTPDPKRPVKALNEKQGLAALNRLYRKDRPSSTPGPR